MGVDKLRRKLRVKGPATFDGAVAFKAAVAGLRASIQIYLTEVTTTLTNAQSGKTHVATKASVTQDFILPSAATEGLIYTFICGHADGEITIQVDGTDTVACIVNPGQAPEVSLVTSAGKGIINTGGTNILGDHITLISDGVSRWYGISQIGIFASEA